MYPKIIKNYNNKVSQTLDSAKCVFIEGVPQHGSTLTKKIDFLGKEKKGKRQGTEMRII